MSEESRQQTDVAGIVVVVLATALFALGVWAGRVTGSGESDQQLLQTQKEQINKLNLDLAEMRGRLLEGRR